MEEVDKNPQLCTTYNLQAEPLIFDSTTLYVKNIPTYFTNEAFFSLMSENERRIIKHHLFSPKNNYSTAVGLVTFMSQAESDDAIYWLNRTSPLGLQLQYANHSTKEIKNVCNPWWNAACEEAYLKQRKAWNAYHHKPTVQNFNNFKKAKSFFRKVRRRGMRECFVRSMAKNINAEVENEEGEKESKIVAEPESEEEIQSMAKNINVEVENEEGEKESKIVAEPESEEEIQVIKEEKRDDTFAPSSSSNLETRSDNTFAFSSSPNLETIRQEVAKFAEERNWNTYHQPRNLLLALVGEIGEVSELFQWKGEVQPGLPGWTDKEKEHLGEELSDVLIYLIRLSDKCHIDLPSAVLKKIALNAKKYPAAKVYGSSKKYTEYGDDS